jgi:hypothetical protein
MASSSSDAALEIAVASIARTVSVFGDRSGSSVMRAVKVRSGCWSPSTFSWNGPIVMSRAFRRHAVLLGRATAPTADQPDA